MFPRPTVPDSKLATYMLLVPDIDPRSSLGYVGIEPQALEGAPPPDS
jgi:hypothetical protein